MEKKSNIKWIAIIIALVLVIVGLICYIVLNIFSTNNKLNEEQSKKEEASKSYTDEQPIKTEKYLTDLNQDNDIEELEINYYGKSSSKYDGKDYRNYMYNNIEIIIKEAGNTNSLVIDGNFSSSNIVDISNEDHFSEIVLIEELNNDQYKNSLFIEYDGRKLEPIKVNYSEDSVKTYNYTNNLNKDIQYISRGTNGKMEISNGDNYVTTVSQLGKMEKYILNDSHEFELEECKLIYDKEFYENTLKDVQSSIKVYETTDLNSQSYGAQETSNIEILEVQDNWLKVKLKSTGAVIFAYIDDIKDYIK